MAQAKAGAGSSVQPEDWLDADSGPLVRPYAAVGGRTEATHQLDMITMVVAVGDLPPAGSSPEHVMAFAACGRPASVAEVAARLRRPAAVTKILLSDLMDSGVVITRAPAAEFSGRPPRDILTKVLHGLKSL